MSDTKLISRCRFCGILRDGEVCARCAKLGHFVLNGVAYYSDGTPMEAGWLGPGRVRPRRAPESEASNAQDRTV